MAQKCHFSHRWGISYSKCSIILPRQAPSGKKHRESKTQKEVLRFSQGEAAFDIESPTKHHNINDGACPAVRKTPSF